MRYLTAAVPHVRLAGIARTVPGHLRTWLAGAGRLQGGRAQEPAASQLESSAQWGSQLGVGQANPQRLLWEKTEGKLRCAISQGPLRLYS